MVHTVRVEVKCEFKRKNKRKWLTHKQRNCMNADVRDKETICKINKNNNIYSKNARFDLRIFSSCFPQVGDSLLSRFLIELLILLEWLAHTSQRSQFSTKDRQLNATATHRNECELLQRPLPFCFNYSNWNGIFVFGIYFDSFFDRSHAECGGKSMNSII